MDETPIVHCALILAISIFVLLIARRKVLDVIYLRTMIILVATYVILNLIDTFGLKGGKNV